MVSNDYIADSLFYDRFFFPFQGDSFLQFHMTGGQWLSVRVLDLRPRGCRFKPHLRQCVVTLSKTHLSLLSTGSTQEDLSRHN